MLINELLQWAVLVFIGVFVFGLTRQLGNFIVPKREQLATEIGPSVGKPLPRDVLSGDARARVARLFAEGGAGFGSLVVVDEECTGCKALIERLERTPLPGGGPLVIMSHKSGPDHAARLNRISPIVISDPEGLTAAGLNTAPFVIVLDEQLKVLHKEVAPDVDFVIERWCKKNDGLDWDEHANRSSPVMTVTNGRSAT